MVRPEATAERNRYLRALFVPRLGSCDCRVRHSWLPPTRAADAAMDATVPPGLWSAGDRRVSTRAALPADKLGIYADHKKADAKGINERVIVGSFLRNRPTLKQASRGDIFGALRESWQSQMAYLNHFKPMIRRLFPRQRKLEKALESKLPFFIDIPCPTFVIKDRHDGHGMLVPPCCMLRMWM